MCRCTPTTRVHQKLGLLTSIESIDLQHSRLLRPEETTDVLQPDAATLEKKKPIIEAWKGATWLTEKDDDCLPLYIFSPFC